MAETDSRIMPRLGLLSTTQSGSGFPPRMQGQTSKELPFYKVGSLSIVGEDGTINDSRNTISIDEAHELKAAIIPPGSILMAKIGAALLLGRFVQTKFDCCIDNNMLALIPQKGVDPRYLHYATCLIDVTHLENPGPIPTLDINGLLQVRIPLPPLPTQRAIADYLNRETAEIDGMRADLDEMERLLTERRRNTIEEALKEAAKHGTIPLGYVATTVAGGTPSTSNSSYWCCDDEEGYPWVTIGDMSSTPVVTTTEKQVTDAGIDAARLSIGEPGTILFAMYGATLGAVSRLGLTASWNQAILLGRAIKEPDGDSALAAVKS